MSASFAAPSILILGFGAFGRLMAGTLAPHLPVSVCDPALTPGDCPFPLVTPEAAGRFAVVVLAVPVPALAGCLRDLAPHLRAGQVVADVCSVKEGPAEAMQRLLPEGVEILATHPMFGPQSAAAGLRGARIVLCPLRGRGWRRIGAFLRRGLGLRVILSTPEEHDRHAALTQGLTHLLARAMGEFVAELPPHPQIRTASFDLMMQGLAMVQGDAPEVFAAVTEGNRHVAGLRRRLAGCLA